MKRRDYYATWLCNTSVAALIVGGFQDVKSEGLRLAAFIVAVLAFWFGRKMTKGDDR